MANFLVTKYPQGTFCWADCSSTDAAQAKAFYCAVFGWETQDLPISPTETYTFFKKDGHTVAALSQMRPDMQAQGIPSHWTNYINVTDVDAITTKAKELGATVVAEPFDVFDNGRMSVIQDPEGATVAFWQAKSHIGASLVNTIGAMSWNELQTRDLEKPKAFYSQLLGWEAASDENDYMFFTNQGRSAAGVMKIAADWGDVPPHWIPYFSVANLDEAIEKATANGAKMVMPAMDAGELGRFSVILDPSGADFYAIELKKVDEWSE